MKDKSWDAGAVFLDAACEDGYAHNIHARRAMLVGICALGIVRSFSAVQAEGLSDLAARCRTCEHSRVFYSVLD